MSFLNVIADEPSRAEDDASIWTLSPDDVEGWCTDGSYAGYGLPKAVVEEIARRVNAAGPFPEELIEQWLKWRR